MSSNSIQLDPTLRSLESLVTEAAQRSDQLLMLLYQHGGSSYLQVLTSDTNYFSAELNLVATRGGELAGSAIARSVELARQAETLGYKRYWVAEHHAIQGLACSATPVLIGHLAAATETIRVGSGGVMLPNHAPLVVAEQFGTLQAMYPGRIDLGLGRAPG